MNQTNQFDTRMLFRYARWAGLLYLVIIVSGITGELFIRAQLIVPGDSVATLASIRSSEALFRTGLLTDTLMLLCDVAVAVLLYVL